MTSDDMCKSATIPIVHVTTLRGDLPESSSLRLDAANVWQPKIGFPTYQNCSLLLVLSVLSSTGSHLFFHVPQFEIDILFMMDIFGNGIRLFPVVIHFDVQMSRGRLS